MSMPIPKYCCNNAPTHIKIFLRYGDHGYSEHNRGYCCPQCMEKYSNELLWKILTFDEYEIYKVMEQ